jgi:hypothetical protein
MGHIGTSIRRDRDVIGDGVSFLDRQRTMLRTPLTELEQGPRGLLMTTSTSGVPRS